MSCDVTAVNHTPMELTVATQQPLKNERLQQTIYFKNLSNSKISKQQLTSVRNGHRLP